MPKILNILKVAVPTLIVVLAVSYVSADWSAPTCGPTGCNAPAPINVSATSQDKLGAIRLNTAVPGSTYGLDVFGISRFFGNLEIGNASFPSKVKIVDGTQGVGKILTSDANGLSSWQTLGTGSVSAVTNIIAGTGIDIDPDTGIGAVTVSATGAPIACTWHTSSGPVETSVFNSNGGIGQCKAIVSAGFQGAGAESYGNVAPSPYLIGAYSCYVTVPNSQGSGSINYSFAPFSYLGCTGIQ